MNGSMMQLPLLISSLLVHAERHHGEQEVVSRRVEGDIHRTTYRELASRSRECRMPRRQVGTTSCSGSGGGTNVRAPSCRAHSTAWLIGGRLMRRSSSISLSIS